jgi:hypothetical protein
MDFLFFYWWPDDREGRPNSTVSVNEKGTR